LAEIAGDHRIAAFPASLSGVHLRTSPSAIEHDGSEYANGMVAGSVMPLSSPAFRVKLRLE
jgi:hypothetical protein